MPFLILLPTDQLPAARCDGPLACGAPANDIPFQQAPRHMVFERMAPHDDLAHFELHRGLDLIQGASKCGGRWSWVTPDGLLIEQFFRHQIGSAHGPMQPHRPHRSRQRKMPRPTPQPCHATTAKTWPAPGAAPARG